MIELAEMTSPIGPLMVAACDGRLCVLSFGMDWAQRRTTLARHLGAVEYRQAADPAGAVTRLQRYFAGEIEALAAIPVAPSGTPFQQRVWTALRAIPAGRTISYGELAHAIGAPHAVRAVGAANGANPIALVIPCHRVIGSDGRLVGYGGGLDRKRWLLAHEGVVTAPAGDGRAVRQEQGVLW